MKPKRTKQTRTIEYKPEARLTIWNGACSDDVRQGEGWKSRFLAALAKIPSVKTACASAGVARMTAYRHRRADEQFARDWDWAIQHSVDDLEAVAFKLALEGDISLIQFLLRSHRPEIYRDTQRHEVGLLGGVVLLPPKEKGDE